MKLSEVLPNVNPDGDVNVCHDVWPLGVALDIYVLCDCPAKHTGKHRHHSKKGRLEWWGSDSPWVVPLGQRLRSSLRSEG